MESFDVAIVGWYATGTLSSSISVEVEVEDMASTSINAYLERVYISNSSLPALALSNTYAFMILIIAGI